MSQRFAIRFPIARSAITKSSSCSSRRITSRSPTSRSRRATRLPERALVNWSCPTTIFYQFPYRFVLVAIETPSLSHRDRGLPLALSRHSPERATTSRAVRSGERTRGSTEYPPTNSSVTETPRMTGRPAARGMQDGSGRRGYRGRSISLSHSLFPVPSSSPLPRRRPPSRRLGRAEARDRRDERDEKGESRR